MDALLLLGEIDTTRIAWALLGITFILGMVTLISPTSISRPADGPAWIDTSRSTVTMVNRQDRRRGSRKMFGTLVVCASCVLAVILFLKT